MQFKDKVALVTGAGSGIGRASAIAFAQHGAVVVVADINLPSAEQTARMITEAGGEASAVAADVSKVPEVAALIDQVVRDYGRLDFAHNNAGIEDSMAFIADSDESNFDRVIATDLKSVWACMKYEIAQMLRQGGGAIVNTASVAGVVGVPGSTAYCAAKHGVVGLTRSASLEYAAQGIRINAVCPGLTRTGIIERLTALAPDVVTSVTPPMQRMAEPSEIAEFVVFMCSDLASFMTGQAVSVDGGWTAM